jgi:hypothetical protein
MSEFFNVHLKGKVVDAHEKFPIRFDYSENGKAFLIGARFVAEIPTNNNSTIRKEINLRAFEEVAEQLAHVTSGAELEVMGSYDMQKSEKDGKWYPIVTVREVIKA